MNSRHTDTPNKYLNSDNQNIRNSKTNLESDIKKRNNNTNPLISSIKIQNTSNFKNEIPISPDHKLNQL